jgi:tetratricopeptide (TPR) repeat protein
MVVKRLLDGRFQFIRVVSSKQYSKTYLMADCNSPSRDKCIVKHLHLPPRNPVALQFLTSLLNKRVELLSRLGHYETVAETLAFFREDYDYYWVRPYVVGHSLQEVLANPKPWPENQVVQLMKTILVILKYLQDNNVVHQNLHPGNIIRKETDGQIIVVDFGLAQEAARLNSSAEQEPKSQNGQADSPQDSGAIYTPFLQGQHHPHYSVDHFSLGMIAFQCATGLVTEALPIIGQDNFLKEAKLQLDECSRLSEPTKGVILGLLNPDPEPIFRKADSILQSLQQLPSQPQLPTKKRKTKQPQEPIQPTPSSLPKTHKTVSYSLWLGLLLLLTAAGLWWLRIPERIRVMGLSDQADQDYQQGQFDSAMYNLDRAIDLSPSRGDLLAQRAEIHWENSNSDAALEDLTQAIQIEPDNPTWYFKRGNIRFQLGDTQGSITDYTDALRLDSRYGEAYVNRGSARAERGDETAAIEDYTEAINFLDDPDKQASVYLNRCLSWSNLGDQSAALEDCTEAINLSPNSSFAYENRGLVKRRLNDLEGALRDFTIAIQIDPGSAEPYYNRGLARADLGDFEGALEDFQQTIDLNPEHPFVFYDRGLIYVEQGNIKNAIADFEQAANHCLDVGRLGCFEDAQFQLQQLNTSD